MNKMYAYWSRRRILTAVNLRFDWLDKINFKYNLDVKFIDAGYCLDRPDSLVD